VCGPRRTRSRRRPGGVVVDRLDEQFAEPLFLRAQLGADRAVQPPHARRPQWTVGLQLSSRRLQTASISRSMAAEMALASASRLTSWPTTDITVAASGDGAGVSSPSTGVDAYRSPLSRRQTYRSSDSGT